MYGMPETALAIAAMKADSSTAWMRSYRVRRTIRRHSTTMTASHTTFLTENPARTFRMPGSRGIR